MKKFVLSLDLHDGKEKRKALKTVSALPGIDEITTDINGKTITVIGIVDPIAVATKLRKYWPTDILSVGPATKPEKKEEPKKEEAKKEEPKKEEEKKEDAKKEKDEAKKAEPAEQVIGTMMMPYRPYYPPPMPYRPYYPQPMPYRPYYPPPIQTYYAGHHQSIEENPNACVIC